MELVIRNNTKENFSWDSEKVNVKFHKNFVKFDIAFLGLHKKFSLVLLQMTNYILRWLNICQLMAREELQLTS